MSSNAFNGGPAFPLPVADQECCGRFESGYGGMSLRDYFAAQWLKGYMANPNTPDMTTDKVAQYAYLMADAMLKEREK